MSYLYHIEHNHEWAIGAKFVISAYDVPPTRIGRPVLGSTDFEWARHSAVSSIEMRPYANLLLAISHPFSIENRRTKLKLIFQFIN